MGQKKMVTLPNGKQVKLNNGSKGFWVTNTTHMRCTESLKYATKGSDRRQWQ